MKLSKKIFYIFILLGLIAAMVYNHELTHIQIAKSYGITEYKISYNWGSISVDYDGSKCGDSCKLANSINEVVGYNIMPVLILIGFFMFVNIIDGGIK